MPIYDFKCPTCGRSREVLTKTGNGGYRCECGQRMERQVSKSNFELKGDGWYKDGYK